MPGQTQVSSQKHKLVGVDKDPAGGVAGYIPSPVKEQVEKLQTAFDNGSTEVQKLYKTHLEPQVGPAVKFMKAKHAQHPEAIRVTAAVLALLYGGCFPRLVLLYVTLKNSESFVRVWEKVMALLGRVNSVEGGAEKKLAYFGESASPDELNGLITDLALNFCYFAAVFLRPICAAPIMGNVLFNCMGKYTSPLITSRLKKTFDGDMGAKWAPFAAKWAQIPVLGMLAYLMPGFAAAFIIGFEGGLRLMESIAKARKMEATEKQLFNWGTALALFGCLIQWYYGFSVGSSWMFMPLRICLLPLSMANGLL